MLECVPARTVVVPLEPILNVRGAANVVPGRMALASDDINESSASALHVDRHGMFGANESSWKNVRRRTGIDAEVRGC